MDIQTLRANHPDHWMRACAIRVLTLDAVAAANSGHSGMPMGMADVATVLFAKHLKFDASAPRWPDRDRFILSAGHGSMLIYSLLYLTGYADMTLDQVKNFRQWGAIIRDRQVPDGRSVAGRQPVHQLVGRLAHAVRRRRVVDAVTACSRGSRTLPSGRPD